MSVALNIAATYRRPSQVMGRLLAAPPHEGRALAYLVGACALMFIAQLPRLSRQSYFDTEQGAAICQQKNIPLAECDAAGEAMMALVGGALMGWIFLAPLLFYAVALVLHGAARVLGGQGSAFDTRIAVFWGLLAASPMMLLLGLVLGFIGTGTQANIVGAVWIGALFWFWIAGLRKAHGTKQDGAA